MYKFFCGQNSNENRCNYSASTFVKDTMTVFGLTALIVLFNSIFKLVRNDIDYKHSDPFPLSDVADVSITSGLIFIFLVFSMVFKNIFPGDLNKDSAECSNVVKNAALTSLSSGLLFGVIALIKYYTDFHNEKNQKTITEREWLDIGESASLLLFAMVLTLIVKDYYDRSKPWTLEKSDYPDIENDNELGATIINDDGDDNKGCCSIFKSR